MADSIEGLAGSPDDAVKRFAQLWWEGDDSADVSPVAMPKRASTVVIRAERV